MAHVLVVIMVGRRCFGAGSLQSTTIIVVQVWEMLLIKDSGKKVDVSMGGV